MSAPRKRRPRPDVKTAHETLRRAWDYLVAFEADPNKHGGSEVWGLVGSLQSCLCRALAALDAGAKYEDRTAREQELDAELQAAERAYEAVRRQLRDCPPQ